MLQSARYTSHPFVYAAIMEAMRESWTDERLDDFRAETARRFDRVDESFDKVDVRFERLEARIDEKFDKVDARFDKVDARFERVDAKFDRVEERLEALNHTMLRLGAGAIVVFVVGFAGLLVS